MDVRSLLIPVVVSILLLCAGRSDASPSGWDAKAVPDERVASGMVGGFSESQRAAYHQGLQHIYNLHERVGSYAIRQVVAQERAREAQRAKLRAGHAISSESVVSAGSYVAIGLLLFLLLGIVIVALRSRTNRLPLQPFDDTPYRLNALKPIAAPNIIPIRGETFYWEVTAEALGPIKNRRYVYGSPGMSFRVARGVYVRSPGRRGHYVDDVRVGVLERGRLLFSNVRVLFIGSSGETAFVGFQRILSIEPLSDGFRLVVDKGHPQTYRTGSPRETVILRRLIAGDFGDHNVPAPSAQGAVASSGQSATAGNGSSSESQRVVERINRDRVSIAQQRANGALTEAEYAKAMHDLDRLAAQVSERGT